MRLDELCAQVVDCEHKTAPIDEDGDFFAVGTPAMRGHTINYSEARRISRQTFVEWTRRLPPAPGDLLLAREAPVGPIVRLPDTANVAPGQRTVLLRPDPRVTDSRFLYYALSAPVTQNALLAKADGSTVHHLNVADIRSFELDVPNVAEQQAIAEVLGALDDKIAANTALAAVADELMLRTFRSMAAGQTVPLSQAAEFINGKAFTKDASGTGRIVVRIAELNSGPSGSTVYSDAVVDDKHVARPGDILFAWSGSLTLHRWFRDEAIVNQHIFKVTPNRGFPRWLTYELVRQKLDDFKAVAADKATTMGHIQRHHLDELVTLPSSSVIAEIDPYMDALWSTSLNAEPESLTLAATRDALLPQLMSGKLRVRDAERIVRGEGAP